MKSDLQQRAERACERYRHNGRKPIVIEFAGVPKAGKSSTISQVQSFLKRCGFKVKTVIERASVCPIRDKKHATFNIWTACTTLAQILENTQDPPRGDDPDILILDRGIFDSVCWLTMMDRLSRITTADRETVERFLLSDEWRTRINGVVLMMTSPEEALRREQGHLPAEPVEGTASIMNPEVLQQVIDTTAQTAQRLKGKFRIFEINTTSGQAKTPEKTSKVVTDIILNLVEDHLAENILHIPKAVLAKHFRDCAVLSGAASETVLQMCREDGKFKPREEVESDESLVQPLPIVVVRNRTGDILQLRRRERRETNPLHQKLVIWAGGHVRCEDAENGDSIIHCIRRELNEELRLSVEEDELRFLGAVYMDIGGKTSKHLALVFEWRAQTDDVAVTLSTAEFFERRGTSLSGKFVPHRELALQVANGADAEPWSEEIIRSLLPSDEVQIPERLF